VSSRTHIHNKTLFLLHPSSPFPKSKFPRQIPILLKEKKKKKKKKKKMLPHLLSLPTEILSQILSSLPLSSLLRFSETCHRSRTMANANLQTLSLGIAPLPSPYQSLLVLPKPPARTAAAISSSSSSHHHHTYYYDTWVRVPNMSSYEYNTLSNFQAALVTSILHRHGSVLQRVELSIWSLTVRMATALRSLHALRSIALRFDNGAGERGHGRHVPRSHVAAERAEQHKAWKVLARWPPPVWSKRLTAFRLDNADLTTEQLGVLLWESCVCRELVLERCRFVGSEVWGVVADWCGVQGLWVLELVECGGVLGTEAVRAIGKMEGLKVCFFFTLFHFLYKKVGFLIYFGGGKGKGVSSPVFFFFDDKGTDF
jgi:hypothetical protein